MRILSFDVGIFNLAYALMEGDDGRLIAWDVISLKRRDEGSKIGFGELVKRLVAELRDRFAEARVDVVLIENQPCMQNPTMKSIQVAIHTFFVVAGVEVVLISASSKLKVREAERVDLSAITCKSPYSRRKKTSEAIARHYLALTQEVNAEWAPQFEASKKRDDLADVYLQALHFLER